MLGQIQKVNKYTQCKSYISYCMVFAALNASTNVYYLFMNVLKCVDNFLGIIIKTINETYILSFS